MSIYCGGLFGGGQGYADICGQTRGYSGKGDLDQCHSCQKKEIDALRIDAGRYRWLRAGSTGHHLISMHLFETISDDCNPPYRAMKYGKTLDEAIDALNSSPENS